jgi:HEAT repeat protein
MNKAIVLLAGCLAVAGCASKPKEPLYQGQTQTQWIQVSRSADAQKRLAAVKVLTDLPSQQAAMERVKALALSDPDPEVRATALDGCYMLLSHEELAGALGKLLVDQRTNAHAITGVGFRRGMAYLGAEAKEFVPELQRIRATATNEPVREAAASALHEIDPKYPAYQRPLE